jgi:hypothetical protein
VAKIYHALLPVSRLSRKNAGFKTMAHLLEMEYHRLLSPYSACLGDDRNRTPPTLRQSSRRFKPGSQVEGSQVEAADPGQYVIGDSER